MSAFMRIAAGTIWIGLVCSTLSAQQAAPAKPAAPAAPVDPLAAKPPAKDLPPPPPANTVAATVNGQPIPELAVYRVLRDEPVKDWPESRKEILGFLIGNAMIDQYLLSLKIAVDPSEVQKRLDEMKKDAEKEKQDWKKLLESMLLTEADLSTQLMCALRWDKYCEQQATEKALRDLFDNNKDIFDGSQVQARHILITGVGADVKIMTLRKEIETRVAQELAALPPTTSDVDRDKARIKAIEKAFGEAAAKYSECPSRQMSGDLGTFGRVGAMVEPFAKAAFELKPYQMSGDVVTEFGHHLILTVDHKTGKEVKYEDIRHVVREVFFDRLREALISDLRPRAQIIVATPPKY